MSGIEIAAADLGVSAIARDKTGRMEMASDIVAAYVTKNSLPASELPAFIASIYAGLGAIGQPLKPVEEPRKEPAVPIKKSITNDYLICLEDGQKFKSLKRHLATAYDLTPSAYRAKWGLPADYPMVAPGYSATRSQLAKAAGLGNARSAAKAAETAASAIKPARKKRPPSNKAS